jgi:predicted nucleic acid-binding protein
MVLIDTSVWIRFLSDQPPYGAKLQQLLNLDQVAGHDLVYGELFIGDRGGRKTLLSEYERMPHVATLAHDEVVAFARHRNLNGRGVSWIDVHLLASAVVEALPVWTADARFAALARELGVAYEPLPHQV